MDLRKVIVCLTETRRIHYGINLPVKSNSFCWTLDHGVWKTGPKLDSISVSSFQEAFFRALPLTPMPRGIDSSAEADFATAKITVSYRMTK